MSLATFVGNFLLRFVLIYMLATLLSNNRINGDLGAYKVPKSIQFWVRPRLLFSSIQLEQARLIGLVHHCIFTITAPIVFLVSTSVFFVDLNLALRIRDTWFKLALLVGIVFMFLIIPLEIVIYIYGKRR